MGSGVGSVVGQAVQQAGQPAPTDPNAISGAIGGGGKGGIGAAPMPVTQPAPIDPTAISGVIGGGGKGGIGAAPIPNTSNPQGTQFGPGINPNDPVAIAAYRNSNPGMPSMGNPQPMQPGMGGKGGAGAQPQPGVGGKGGMGSAPSVNHLANLLGGKGGVHQQPNPIPAPTMDHRQTLGPMQGGNNTPNLLNNLHPKTNVGGLNSLHPTTVNPAVDPSFQSLYPGVNPNAGTPVNPNTFG